MTSTTTVTDRLDALTLQIGSYRYTVNNEDQLQQAIAEVLAAHDRREVILDHASRVDLLVDRVAIEVKTGGSYVDALRQCQRYARHPDVDAVLLVSTQPAHDMSRNRLGGELGGKPFRTLIVKGGAI